MAATFSLRKRWPPALSTPLRDWQLLLYPEIGYSFTRVVTTHLLKLGWLLLLSKSAAPQSKINVPLCQSGVVATCLPKINIPLCKSGGHSSTQNQPTLLQKWWLLLYPKSTYPFARVVAAPLPKINIPLCKSGGHSSTKNQDRKSVV